MNGARSLLRLGVVSMLGACASAPSSVPTTDGAVTATPTTPSADLGPAPFDEAPIGWASVADLELAGTTGGDGGEVVEVSTTADFATQAKMAGPRIILVSGVIGENTRVSITANHTIIGLPGAEFHGGLKISGASNIILRNLKIVGNNCLDNADCQSGADAVSIGDHSHHVWVDHCEISDGSDGNLDVNGGSDYVTVSWTKFWYSGSRPGGHQFSNLVGSSDNEPDDVGHLRVTYHHDWWATGVRERMPRVRYGQVHIFNNLYTASGNSYCVGLGYFANILTEANAFYDVRDPIESSSYANAQSVIASRDNLYVGSSDKYTDRGTGVFVPPYPYAKDAAVDVRAQVENRAGVCPSRYAFSATPVVSCTAADNAP